MFIGNLFKHIWNKVYFDNDLPKDRNELCELDIGKALFEFFVPTTKRKDSVSKWLGFYQWKEPYAHNQEVINSISDLNAKAVFIIFIDALLYIPRLALNIIKLITEVLPLTLRELAYAAFESMVEGADKTKGISKRLYQLAAGIFWFFTSLLSLIYLIGSLLTSPGMTIISMGDTLEKLECPAPLILAISGFFCLSVFAFHLTMIVILAPIILPISVVMTPGALVIEGSGWIGGAVEFALVFFGMSGLMFNNNPDSDSLVFEGKMTSLSIYPTEFSRIADEKSYQKQLDELKIKKFGDKATEPQKAKYKERAEKDHMDFLRICQTNAYLFSIEEVSRYFAIHNLKEQFARVAQPQKLELVRIEEVNNFPANFNLKEPMASAQPQEIELFKEVVGKILYRLSKEENRQKECQNENEKDNIDVAIEFVNLLPDWAILSIDFKPGDSADFSYFIGCYAQSDKSKLWHLLNSSVCRVNNTWLVRYVAEKIWFALVDSFFSKEEKLKDLKEVLSFLSFLSDKDCNFLVKCEDLERMYLSVDNAMLVLEVLPRLFVHCGIKLVSCYFYDKQFMEFLEKNYQGLNISEMIDKITSKKKLTNEKKLNEIKSALPHLYRYLSQQDQKKVDKAFPDDNFSNYTSHSNNAPRTSTHANYHSSSKRASFHGASSYHSHDSVFASEHGLDARREIEERNKRIKQAETYANEGVDLYKEFKCNPQASPGELRSAINKFYRDQAQDFNKGESKATLQELNEYKAILLCPHARPAYDQARASFGFSVKSFFNS